MLVFLLVLVASFAAEAQNLSAECKDLYQKNDFLHCVDLPFLEYPRQQSEDCWNKCQNDVCRYRECKYEVTGVYVNGEYSKQKYLEGYEMYFDLNETILSDKKEWMLVVEKSYETCEKLVIDAINETACNVPPFIHALHDCMDYMNFINCPRSLFNKSERCSAVKSFVETQKSCGRVLHDVWVLDKFYWYPYTFEDKNIVSRPMEISAECKRIYSENIITNCTGLPYATIPAERNDQCIRNCRFSTCCITECQLSSLINEGGKLNKKAYIELVLAFFKGWNPEAAELWKSTVEKSYEICEKLLMPLSKRVGPCSVHIHFFTLYDCMDNMNFLYCPPSLFDSSERCSALQKFVATQKTCGIQIGDDWVLDYSFWNPQSDVQTTDSSDSSTTAMS